MGNFKNISKYKPSILQGTLEFAAARKSAVYATEHPYESAFMRTLLLVLVVLCAGYLYFVGASVLNIIARKEATTETTRLQSSLARMEQEFFALSEGIDESIASSVGLGPIANAQYVYRPGSAVAATIPGNGI